MTNATRQALTGDQVQEIEAPMTEVLHAIVRLLEICRLDYSSCVWYSCQLKVQSLPFD
jgi:hypothetical protein